MFIVSADPHPETLKTLQRFEKMLGRVPPHFELLATLHPKRFELFVLEIRHLLTHPTIAPDFFIFLRLHIAAREGFEYCRAFNTKLLQSNGHAPELIAAVENSIEAVPLDERHRHLARSALLALYEPERFRRETLDSLREKGWNASDIYDAVDHAAFLFKNARIIRAYLDAEPA